MVAKSPAFQLCEGLPRPPPVDSFLEQLLRALKATNAEVEMMRENNQKLTGDLEEMRKKVMASDVGALQASMEALQARVKVLEDKLQIAEDKLQVAQDKLEGKANGSEVSEIKDKAEAALDASNRMQTEMTTFIVDNSKWSKTVDTKLSGLQSSLSDQIGLLSDSKANKVDVAEFKTKHDDMVTTNKKIQSDMDTLEKLLKDFLDDARASLAAKADMDLLNDKMGRSETDDLLNQLTHQLTERLRKTGNDLQEVREDLDVILTMIMQDANVGAGMLKCISCERPVALHRPGPPPASGREPTMTQGKDKQFYRASKDDAVYSPRWQSSSQNKASAAAAPHAVSAGRTSDLSPTRLDERGMAEGRRNRPLSAKGARTGEQRAGARPSSAHARSSIA